MLNVFFVVIILSEYSNCWNYDPYCMINTCEENGPASQPETESSFFSKNNPYCLIFSCANDHIDEENRKLDFSWNPTCWFKNCPDKSQQKREEFQKFWRYDFWFNEEDPRTWNEKFVCLFKKCPPSKNKVEENIKSEQESYFHGTYSAILNYLNAAKPQEVIIDHLFTSQLNPYCWLTECCNDNTLPGNVEKLSELIQLHLYGQHLANTVVEAIGSHWNPRHQSKKALTFSFHGPVGTGKNYVSEMIANSLFKLGVKSKYVHYFSGRLHFTLGKNSEEYTQNLYSWLKGNVTQCPKQLFIFDEADHMPEQVLNYILPMLDYREKVDGADYRNCIFIFLSNAGSELILNKVDNLYQENKTRMELQIGDFEREIIMGIFNQEGGFFHSDTITHNLIDHYIPFLPMEEPHVMECILDQFRERNVNPSEEHINDVLNSIAWGETKQLKFAKTGCKTVGSKVAYFCEKYYKLIGEKKVDL